MNNNLRAVDKVAPDPIKVAMDSQEDYERRENNLNYLILFTQEKLTMNEEKILDVSPKNINSNIIDTCYLEYEKWSKRLHWLTWIKQNRYIVPREQAKNAEKTRLSEEDAKRLDLEIVPA